MYEWLLDALNNAGTVVTANRRLAKTLLEEYSAQQVAAGMQAWPSPAILALPDWLTSHIANASDQSDLPVRITQYQSQLLWERCLRKELPDCPANAGHIVALLRDSWQRMADWQLTIKDVARTALSDDQKLFASVAGRYLRILESENWIDDAGIGEIVLRLINDKLASVGPSCTFAGFQRAQPMVQSLQEALQLVGTDVKSVSAMHRKGDLQLYTFVDENQEFRTAGAWARQQLKINPRATVAVVASDLEAQADRYARLVREGMTPGWQYGSSSLRGALNVSYGQRLGDYPAIRAALLLLHWLVRDIAAADVSFLLRTSALGPRHRAAQHRMELQLRQLPDRGWSPSMITSEFRGKSGHDKSADSDGDSESWLTLLASFSKRRRDLPRVAKPSEWVVRIDNILSDFHWPGHGALDSADFQLVSRWRELLNDFAKLGLVSQPFTIATAVARLEQMAGDSVFQPESSHAQVQLLGPLEASGSGFDCLWISGASADKWPPASSPSRLLSRRLQEQHDMPDCSPDNTYRYAKQVFDGLLDASPATICSFALHDDDIERSASTLLPIDAIADLETVQPAGWYANELRRETVVVADRVPRVLPGETISGGAGTVQRQVLEPLSAFAHGRLGARLIYPQVIGISAALRGNLIHDALYRLYLDLPSSDELASWRGESLDERVDIAVEMAFTRHESNCDAVLRQLLQLERVRVRRLIKEFVAIDGGRGDFTIASVEGQFEFAAGNLRLMLRFDRIDKHADGSIEILDYKSGARKQLLNRAGEVREIQLFVYAAATDVPVSALALVNIDSREISFSGAGVGYTDAAEWPALLSRVQQQVSVACEDLAAGDVRLARGQDLKSARSLNLLSRFTELRRES